ncbi:MAG: Coenzyme F420 hydrogenase/dehydrogenase, beta subunit C-terminal domain [Paludibacteraceae bacterium]|nr:Coenzyme F420 hydrogenase/dehydrogenase, beta subunit C-terminal domain [Paludibacteraceae bacterium]
MKLNKKGFYEPELYQQETKDDEKLIKQLCPSIHVETKPNKGTWGSMKSVKEAWSADKLIRHKAASGGVITSLAIHLLEKRKVDAVLQVGVCDDSYLFNELKVSRTREDVIRNAQSRYAPALVFNQIKQIFEKTSDNFAFIGKPCDVAAMRNFLDVYSQYKERVSFFLSIFCAGMPSYEATKCILMQSNHTDEPLRLKYRGDGWPGNFCAEFADCSKYEISYNESWGTVLNKYLPYRCKICPDGIGMLADISVGDSWNTIDGYPDFTEAEGRCFCMIRTEVGEELINDAISTGYIESRNLDVSKIKDQQRYQYERRKLTGWRLLPIQLLTGFMIKFKGLGIFKQALTSNLRTGINNARGSFYRIRNL